MNTNTPPHTAFIGGGNMATAIIGGLIQQGLPAEHIFVIDPSTAQRNRLAHDFGVTVFAEAGKFLAQAGTVVWAIKPQLFKEAALATKPYLAELNPLHVSVAAGILTSHIARWLGNDRIVRVMPNTPALIGRGIAGLYALPAVTQADREHAQTLMQAVGQTLWLEEETQMDGITAISGSGPAYVFYLIEAMETAARGLGFTAEQATLLATATVSGSAELAVRSGESAATLRERVTSKGGTTYAALTHMDACGIKQHLIEAIYQAAQRSKELGKEFGT